MPAVRDTRNSVGCVDSLSKTYFIGKQRSFRKRRLKREQSGVDLTRIQIHLRVDKRGGKALVTVRRKTPVQLVSNEFRVVIGQEHKGLE